MPAALSCARTRCDGAIAASASASTAVIVGLFIASPHDRASFARSIFMVKSETEKWECLHIGCAKMHRQSHPPARNVLRAALTSVGITAGSAFFLVGKTFARVFARCESATRAVIFPGNPGITTDNRSGGGRRCGQ